MTTKLGSSSEGVLQQQGKVDKKDPSLLTVAERAAYFAQKIAAQQPAEPVLMHVTRATTTPLPSQDKVSGSADQIFRAPSFNSTNNVPARLQWLEQKYMPAFEVQNELGAVTWADLEQFHQDWGPLEEVGFDRVENVETKRPWPETN